MRKFIAILSAMILMVNFTACNGSIGQSESDEFNQEVADSTISMLNEYYEGMRNADFDLAFKNYAPFYIENIELELEYYGGSKDEYISENNSMYYIENYGEDATITAEVVSTTLMTKSVTKKYNKLVTDFYMSDEIIDSVYTVIVNKLVTGQLKSDSQQETWTVLEIDNSYYLYDDYFEQLADALQTSNDDNQTVTLVVS